MGMLTKETKAEAHLKRQQYGLPSFRLNEIKADVETPYKKNMKQPPDSSLGGALELPSLRKSKAGLGGGLAQIQSQQAMLPLSNKHNSITRLSAVDHPGLTKQATQQRIMARNASDLRADFLSPFAQPQHLRSYNSTSAQNLQAAFSLPYTNEYGAETSDDEDSRRDGVRDLKTEDQTPRRAQSIAFLGQNSVGAYERAVQVEKVKEAKTLVYEKLKYQIKQVEEKIKLKKKYRSLMGKPMHEDDSAPVTNLDKRRQYEKKRQFEGFQKDERSMNKLKDRRISDGR